MRVNLFFECSVCYEIGSVYAQAAQHAIKSFPHMLSKILKKKILNSSSKKFGSAHAQSPRKCSNIEILAKIDGKKAKFF